MEILMRTLGLALTLTAAPALAGPQVTPEDAAEIRQTIEEQVRAFQRGDAEAAFRLATPGIQARFGTPDRFLEVVQRDYAPVADPRSWSFRQPVGVPDAIGQLVIFRGDDGTETAALYLMEETADGLWLTNGCLILDQQVRPGV